MPHTVENRWKSTYKPSSRFCSILLYGHDFNLDFDGRNITSKVVSYSITSAGYGADLCFLVVIPQVTVINPAVDCCYFSPGPRLPSEPKRSPPLASTKLYCLVKATMQQFQNKQVILSLEELFTHCHCRQFGYQLLVSVVYCKALHIASLNQWHNNCISRIDKVFLVKLRHFVNIVIQHFLPSKPKNWRLFLCH